MTARSGFEAVADAFVRAQAEEPGAAQLAVYHQGELVVDVSAGCDPDAVCVLMSVTKGMTASCVHLLAQRSLLDFDAPVARYWPRFEATDVTVRHVLSHSAGLVGFPPDSGVGGREYRDWDLCTGTLAGMKPLWEPGTAFAYHALTYGFLAGEVVRRITGRSIGRFFADEIAGPLGLDLWIGLPESQEHRVLDQFSAQPMPTREQITDMYATLGLDVTDPLVRTIIGISAAQAEAAPMLNSRAGHAAEVPAGNGIGNARSLARFYAAHIGEIDGIRLLDDDTIRRATTPQTDGLSAPGVLAALPQKYPLRFGLGYEIMRAGSPMLGETSFGHTGAGGRLGFADPATGTAVGYVCTNMSWVPQLGPDRRWLPWLDALRDSVA